MYLVFDIGGTNMRFARSNDGAALDELVILPTPHDFDTAMATFETAYAQYAADGAVTVACGGVRGILNTERTELVSESILASWVGKPLQHTIAEITKCPVFLENDAALAALGEATVGAGKGNHIVGYLTVSTGVGGARVQNGVLDGVHGGFEPGKHIIDPDKTLCPDCPGNTLEDYISGRALHTRFGKDPKEITDQKVWEELAQFLALGIENIIALWSPDVVVVGGPMVLGAPAISLDRVAERLRERGITIPIVRGTLSDQAGLLGGLTYIAQHHL